VDDLADRRVCRAVDEGWWAGRRRGSWSGGSCGLRGRGGSWSGWDRGRGWGSECGGRRRGTAVVGGDGRGGPGSDPVVGGRRGVCGCGERKEEGQAGEARVCRHRIVNLGGRIFRRTILLWMTGRRLRRVWRMQAAFTYSCIRNMKAGNRQQETENRAAEDAREEWMIEK